MTISAAPIGKAVGTAHVRVEGRDKVTLAARYAGEVLFAGLAHGWLALSTVARGRVRSVQSAPVLGMPGVLAVLHHGNALPVDADFVIPSLGIKPDPTLALFQSDRVAYRGWPVALVVAESSEQVREAAEALVVHYERRTPPPHSAGSPGSCGPAGSWCSTSSTSSCPAPRGRRARRGTTATGCSPRCTTQSEHHRTRAPAQPHLPRRRTCRPDGRVPGSGRGGRGRTALPLAGVLTARPRTGAGEGRPVPAPGPRLRRHPAGPVGEGRTGTGQSGPGGLAVRRLDPSAVRHGR